MIACKFFQLSFPRRHMKWVMMCCLTSSIVLIAARPLWPCRSKATIVHSIIISSSLQSRCNALIKLSFSFQALSNIAVGCKHIPSSYFNSIVDLHSQTSSCYGLLQFTRITGWWSLFWACLQRQNPLSILWATLKLLHGFFSLYFIRRRAFTISLGLMNHPFPSLGLAGSAFLTIESM